MNHHELLNRFNHFSEARKIPRKCLKEFQFLENAIRVGSHPDEPHLLRRWDYLLQSNSLLTRIDCQYNLYYQYYFLLDVIADDLVDRNWRQQCAKEIYIPMERIYLFCSCESNNSSAYELYNQFFETLYYTKL